MTYKTNEIPLNMHDSYLQSVGGEKKLVKMWAIAVA